jgi:hypothetical protein
VSTSLITWNIYWDGSQWILDYLDGTTPIIGVTNSPLGIFQFESDVNFFIFGEIICGQSNGLCGTLCTSQSCEEFSFLEGISSGTTFWQSVNSSYGIVYSAESNYYVFYEGSVDNVIGILPVSSENELPIGPFEQLVGYTSFETLSGSCIPNCVCANFVANTPETIVKYTNCNGISETVDMSITPDFTACTLENNFSVIQGGVTIFGCDDSLCQTTQVSEKSINKIELNNLFKNISYPPKSTVKKSYYSEVNPCESPTPTPTPSATFCPTPTPSKACPPPPPPDCVVDTRSCYPILTYRIVDVCFNTITLDRPTPDFSYLSGPCYARTIIYPPSMVSFYDSYTPRPHWNDNVINFESVCYTDEFDVKIWNMNIPWSENPAGLNSSISKDYTQFGSIQYLGTKEYLGYASSSGQTDTDSVYYFNSFGDKIIVTPEEQKAIAIIHYTNQTVDFFYGEKFALEPFENVDDTTGQARNFKLHIPWLMWHKNPDCCHGQTFWVDPPGFDDLELFKVHYIQSKKNVDMNNPGIRYYHLWDDNPNIDGTPNRVGKVFPDAKIIIIDDEELIAAMSYKSNRNWTLPAPRLSLITPNTCGTDNNSVVGILTGESETLYVTYRLTNTSIFTNSLHNNYYSSIQGPNLCLPFSSQNVGVRFGGEFNCLNEIPSVTTTTTFNPVTTTTTFNPSTTTTTTSNPICGKCYQIVGSKFDTDVEYKNCSGEITTISVGALFGTPQFVCSQTIPTGEVGVYSLGDCTVSTNCEPCWMTGFTFTFAFPGAYGDPDAVLNLYFTPSGQYSNGYPVFVNAVLFSNIQFTGTEWVFRTLTSYPLISTMFTGATPINSFDFIYDETQFSGQTYCSEPDYFCMSITSGGTTSFINFTSFNYTGGTAYNEFFDNDLSVIFTGGSWTVVDIILNTVATLPGVPQNEQPIGSWVTVDPSVTITTSSGACPTNCYCLGITGNTAEDTIVYTNCNGIIYNIITNSGLVTEVCVSDFFITSGSPITGICETICGPIIANNYEEFYNPILTTTTTFCPPYCDVTSGFFANKFEIIVQKVPTGERPSSSEWKIIDFTDQLTPTMINGFITQEGLTGNTFVISQEAYDDAPYYNLNDYIDLTPAGFTGSQLNFGDEYYFYGSLETDIQATIYEMRYKINLGQSEFLATSNPSWTNGNPSYVTEIGLYDSDKNLMIISKMQSPVLRQGIQQFLIKFDL